MHIRATKQKRSPTRDVVSKIHEMSCPDISSAIRPISEASTFGTYGARCRQPVDRRATGALEECADGICLRQNAGVHEALGYPVPEELVVLRDVCARGEWINRCVPTIGQGRIPKNLHGACEFAPASLIEGRRGRAA